MNPVSQCYLARVPFKYHGGHTIDFPNFNEQLQYFTSLSDRHYYNFTYIRQDSTICIDDSLENVINYNYVVYYNNNKWWFSFIDSQEYVNDNMTKLHTVVDVFQTFLFDFRFHQCFIEREHVADDTIGLHTIPENLELGPYIVNARTPEPTLALQYKIVVASTISLDDLSPAGGNFYDRIYSGVTYYAYDNATEINEVLEKVANAGKSDAISAIFMVPSNLISVNDSTKKVNPSYGYNRFDWDGISKLTSINGYKPKNNKLFTYPFCYINATNNAGNSAVYRYELFSTSNINFEIFGSLSPSMSIKLVPKNYNNDTDNYEEGIMLGKLPVCSWQTDVYTNWLTQNAVNIETNIEKAGYNFVTGAVSSAVTNNPLGVISSAANAYFSIKDIMAQKYQQSLIPPQANGNLNAGDVNFTNFQSTFTLYHMSVKKEYAEIIDDYFTMYGYQVNRVAYPNVNTRPVFNYLKTVGSCVRGNFPQEYIDEFDQIFNDGLTIWHQPNNIFNYNVNNK